MGEYASTDDGLQAAEFADATLGDVDPVPPSARRALPPLAPPLDRGVQPVVAVGVVAAMIIAWWLRRQWLTRPGRSS